MHRMDQLELEMGKKASSGIELLMKSVGGVVILGYSAVELSANQIPSFPMAEAHDS